MTGKLKSEAERACIDAIDEFEAEATADLLREFGVAQICDVPPQFGGSSVAPQSSQTGKRKAGRIRPPSSDATE